MRLTVLALLTATVLGGIARADTVSETVTGIIQSEAGFEHGNVYDQYDRFNGGNLYGDQVNLSFSFDIGLLAQNNSVTPADNGFELYYYDQNNADGALSEGLSVTGASTQYAVNGTTGRQIEWVVYCYDPDQCAGDSHELMLSESIDSGAEYVLMEFYGSGSIGDLASQSDLDAYFSTVTSGVFEVCSGDNCSDPTPGISFSVASAATPEPGTWGMSAVAGLTLAGIVRRRQRGCIRS